jgi:hypothetical protein
LKIDSHAAIELFCIDVLYDVLDVLDVLSEQNEAVVQRLANFFEGKTFRNVPKAYYDVARMFLRALVGRIAHVWFL